MTILYKPVLIESAAQAEALPEGIVLIRDDHFVFQKYEGQFVSADPHDLPTGAAWEVIGWTALVPIEAEESHSEDYGSYHLVEAVDGPKPFTAYLVDQEEA